MRYLITGATGFVGPYLVRALVEKGHTCRCLVREGSHTDGLMHSGVERVQGDVTRPKTLEGLAEGADGVFHLATLGHMSNFRVTGEMFEAVNVRGTINVMTEALRAGVQRVVHCSSVAAMGIVQEVPAIEESPCNPHHPYGRSKLEAERAVRRMVREQDLRAVIVRFSMVYGPGDSRDILRLTRMAKKGRFPRVGNRPKLTPLIHVEDAVRGLMAALNRGRAGETYLITNAASMPFDRIREVIQQALGRRPWALWVPESAVLCAASMAETIWRLLGKAPPVTRKNIESTLADRVFSINKARRELGFEPEKDPEEGLRETVAWYREKGWV